jgi:hypothetical protein
MSLPRLALKGIRVDGTGAPSARLEFRPGLNLVVGASDTGKTYVCSLIDFLLGAGTAPEDIPESMPYDMAFLGLVLPDRDEVTVMRSFKDDKVRLQKAPWTSADPSAQHTELSAAHRTGNTSSLSYFLLACLGLADLRLKRSKEDLSALTFRHVAHLIIKDEERIITKNSPALTGQYTAGTLDRSAFYFFLTGNDDSAAAAGPDERKDLTALQAEHTVLTGFAEARKRRLAELVGGDADVAGQLTRIDQAIQAATTFAASTNEEIALLENNRADKWAQLNKQSARRLFLKEQVRRLELLRNFYVSDKARLTAIVEAGASFQSIKDGTCAVCGSVPNEATSNLAMVQKGCLSEIAKIDVLHQELAVGLRDLETDLRSNETSVAELEAAIHSIDADLQKRLKSQSDRARIQLTDLVTSRQRFESAKETQLQLQDLQTRVQQVERDLAPAAEKPKRTARRKDASAEADFCEEIRSTLQRWKFPKTGSVRLDAEKCDLVIDDQARGSFGKGYRAFTHAAFTIGLMRHCRKRGIAHPGFVLLDTPLNPLRGPDEAQQAKVEDPMKRAFFEDLAGDNSGDQFIIFENSEPPAELQTQMNYVHFSRNPLLGRPGFFPVKK